MLILTTAKHFFSVFKLKTSYLSYLIIHLVVSISISYRFNKKEHLNLNRLPIKISMLQIQTQICMENMLHLPINFISSVYHGTRFQRRKKSGSNHITLQRNQEQSFKNINAFFMTSQRATLGQPLSLTYFVIDYNCLEQYFGSKISLYKIYNHSSTCATPRVLLEHC